ncbi:MAG: helix-turn-helix domain-containing protein, partial [Prevotella sp.]|nr:helix-turn-helix domain-containing protein [Prevotella sp.]
FQHLGPAQGICPDDVLSVTRIGDDVVIVSIDDVSIYDPKTDKSCIYTTPFWGTQLRFSDASPLRLPDGRWMFAMENGVMLVPEKVWKQKTYSPKIVISSVKIENNETQYNVNDIDTIVLESDERNVNISFAAIDFSAEQRLLYQTRFKSGEWEAPTEDHNARLYDLAPGEHTLQIRSTNAQGLWTDNVRSVLIIVKPHWYETLWAKALYLLILVVIISGVTHLIYYIREIDRQRSDTLNAYLALLQKSTVQHTDNKEEVISQEIPNSIPVSRQNPEDEAFMAKLLACIDANIGNSDAGVDDLADAVAMSRSSLTRRTKSLLGVTPSDLLREARMKLACRMLKEHSHHTISEVAYSCGFSDPKYFAKCFKTSVGMSPKQYSQGSTEDKN